MRLVKGADVYSSSGEKLGTLSRVILDPNSREVTHIVIEKGYLFTTNKIVPIDKLNPENQEMIILRSSEEAIEQFEDFEESQYVNLDESEVPPGDIASSFWFPPTNYAWWRTGSQMISPPMPVYSLKTTQNIPDGTIALEEGATVRSADDKDVGDIEQLIVDPQDNRVTHFVVSAGLLFKERKLVPVLWIATIGEREVHLSVNARTLEKLPAYQNAG